MSEGLKKMSRFRDVQTHQRLYPRHSIYWFGMDPFYCTGGHAPGDHDWQPVPHYEDERCEV